MKVIPKLVSAVVAATSLLAGANAAATQFNPFSVLAPDGMSFTADKITGNYSEIITINKNDTFNASLYFDAGQFVTNGGQTALKGTVTGLNKTYALYAVYKASGTVSRNGAMTYFTYTQETGSLSLFLDRKQDSDGTRPALGSGDFAMAGTLDDVLLAEGNALGGTGTLTPAASTCGNNGINCGSFGSTTGISLTAAGKQFFVAPKPFYNISFQSGQFNVFNPTGTQEVNGSMDVVFNSAAVPEPASLGLLGLGLAGVGIIRRRKQAG
jgi:hypothetical protein